MGIPPLYDVILSLIYLIFIMYLQDRLIAGKFVHQFLCLLQQVVSGHTALLPVKPWTDRLRGISIGELWLLLL